MSGCSTWDDLPPLAEPVLLVLNSHGTAVHEIGQVIERLARLVPVDHVRVIGPSDWADEAHRLGIKRRHFRHTRVGSENQELSLNYFLETPPALSWMARLAPKTILGSSPHNLYNEEVKDIFELRMAAVMHDAVLLAHSLPNPYVYQLTTDDILERAARSVKVAAYRASIAAVLADFHQQWTALGSPAADDRPAFDDVAATFARHLGPAVMSFDEASAIPLAPVDTAPARAAAFEFVRDRLLNALRHS